MWSCNLAHPCRTLKATLETVSWWTCKSRAMSRLLEPDVSDAMISIFLSCESSFIRSAHHRWMITLVLMWFCMDFYIQPGFVKQQKVTLLTRFDVTR